MYSSPLFSFQMELKERTFSLPPQQQQEQNSIVYIVCVGPCPGLSRVFSSQINHLIFSSFISVGTNSISFIKNQ